MKKPVKKVAVKKPAAKKVAKKPVAKRTKKYEDGGVLTRMGVGTDKPLFNKPAPSKESDDAGDDTPKGGLLTRMGVGTDKPVFNKPAPTAPDLRGPRVTRDAKDAVNRAADDLAKSNPKPKTSSRVAGTVKTKGGDYNVYKKGSYEADSFGKAFNAAKEGAVFDWNGKKYKKISAKK